MQNVSAIPSSPTSHLGASMSDDQINDLRAAAAAAMADWLDAIVKAGIEPSTAILKLMADLHAKAA